MLDFTHIKYGITLALIAILFGGTLGLSFGCCEHDIKDLLKSRSDAVLAQKYNGDTAAADKVVSKSWIYFKRAHFHSQTMGVISIVFSLIVAFLRLNPRFQLGVSILSGLGSLGYGIFWLIAGFLAPAMGSTGAAKETVALIAQASGGAFFVAGAGVFTLLVYTMFLQKKPG